MGGRSGRIAVFSFSYKLSMTRLTTLTLNLIAAGFALLREVPIVLIVFRSPKWNMHVFNALCCLWKCAPNPKWVGFLRFVFPLFC